MRGEWIAIALVAAFAGCGADDRRGDGNPGAPEPTAGFDGQTIRLGVVSALSGPVAVLGVPATEGQQVWFDHINARGGIAGKYKVELVEKDARFEPSITVQRYNRLKQDVVMFAQVFGTANTRALLPQLKRDRMIAVPWSLDSAWISEPNLLPHGNPYQLWAINALDYYIHKGGGEGRRVCAVLQADAAGDAAGEGLDFAVARLDIALATTQRFKLGASDFTAQVQALERARCEAVFVAATPVNLGPLWATAAKRGFAPRWIAPAAAWVHAFARPPLGAYLRRTVWLVGEGTEWGDTTVPGMRAMLAHVRRFKPDVKPNLAFIVGYNGARAATTLLERAVGRGDLSRGGLLAASEELGTVSFDGLTGNYRYGPAERRDPPRESTLFEVDPDKPLGLGRLAYNYKSKFADDFEFHPPDR